MYLLERGQATSRIKFSLRVTIIVIFTVLLPVKSLFHCRNKPTALKKHNGVIQIALAITQALENSSCATQDRLFAMEKGLLQSIDEKDLTPVFVQLTTMLSNESHNKADKR